MVESGGYRTLCGITSWRNIIAEIERVHGNKHSENKLKNYYNSKKRKDSKKKQEAENNYEKDDDDDHEGDEGDYENEGDYDGDDEDISSPSNSSTIDIDNDW